MNIGIMLSTRLALCVCGWMNCKDRNGSVQIDLYSRLPLLNTLNENVYTYYLKILQRRYLTDFIPIQPLFSYSVRYFALPLVEIELKISVGVAE